MNIHKSAKKMIQKKGWNNDSLVYLKRDYDNNPKTCKRGLIENLLPLYYVSHINHVNNALYDNPETALKNIDTSRIINHTSFHPSQKGTQDIVAE